MKSCGDRRCDGGIALQGPVVRRRGAHNIWEPWLPIGALGVYRTSDVPRCATGATWAPRCRDTGAAARVFRRGPEGALDSRTAHGAGDVVL
jgi:hypothetical protein